MSRILPRQTGLSEPYWAGCREGELRLQHCANCNAFQFYPRVFCSHCGHRELDWRAVSGRGRIASYTVVRRGISEAYPAPYVVALVDLEEGPRMMSHIIDCDADAVRIGMAVSATFADWGEDTHLPVFKLIEEGEAS